MTDHFTHRIAPERPSLRLLLAALEVACDAVRDKHPRLSYLPRESHPALPASEVLAELLVERCAELEALIQRYNAVIGHAPSDDFDDLPF